MTHYQILLRELAKHGSVTYAQLVRRYPDYDYHGFTAAVYKARKDGVVAPSNASKRAPIVAVGACPCCGREL